MMIAAGVFSTVMEDWTADAQLRKPAGGRTPWPA